MSEVILKNPEQLALMRRAGQLLAQVFADLDGFIRAGVTTMQINDRAEAFIVETLKARPASKGQYGFPYSLNTSVDHVVCHGMPKVDEVLQEGSIINVDITLEQGGYIADSSKMYRIGAISEEARRLVDTTYEALWKGIEQVRPGATLGDIGHAIQQFAEAAGYSVVREYCGHGIGRQMHEAPQVLHYGQRGMGLKLKPGMVFTIEPMINQGARGTRTLKDGWTVITRDGGLSAQWEHTVAVTEQGYEVLTLRAEEGRR
ncbi:MULTISPECIES: type I methionyl aminopeptidase [Pseudomonas]|uniref:type I methionyl aminopeptidase n=1 Tax=Pseudomonas TaxID=286 RepID=UPI0008195FAA|nr:MULTISPECIES: type I methionyl aminopeptidase [Pseudomonas]MBC3419331.1 type I methionyl aminopeptidase [Pseudomonas sp. RW3S2]OCT25963.1 type I methionyl aminopeptidase [Pseudomonas putida]OCT27887.1 type I methionyl aminopeptidase [Pseudomonas putida]OCT32385.1 type I methionyl aminopeptidase [Pseudomonas putida]OCT38744.1 type I methionyl aminopeptidase [Pseudomonas putida]